MSSPRVFVVQRVRHISHRTGELEDKHDLTPAARFGELIYLLDGMSGRPNHASFSFDLSKIIEILDQANLTHEDCLLPMGAPTLIGAATAIFADIMGGKLRLLQWDQKRADYVLMQGCIVCSSMTCEGHE